jgi:hypothetical protein
VTVTERTVDPPSGWPDASILSNLAKGHRLVLLPDRVEELNGELRASYRDDAQALRVAAQRAGMEVVFGAPDGAKPATYREHDATLVLSFVLSIPGGLIGTLLANEIQRHLDRWRDEKTDDVAQLKVRAREVVIEAGRTKVREIEGPGEEVVAWLSQPVPEPAENSRPADDTRKPTKDDV